MIKQFKKDNEVFGVFSSQEYENSVSGVENITRPANKSQALN